MIEREEFTFYFRKAGYMQERKPKSKRFSSEKNKFDNISETVFVISRGLRFECDEVNVFFPPLPPAVCVSRQPSLYSEGSLLEEAILVQRRALKIVCCKIKRVSKQWHKPLIFANNEPPECVLRLIFHILNQVRCKLIQVQS